MFASILLFTSVGLLAAGSSLAHAAFPGRNGRIVYVVDANAAGQGNLLVARDPSGGGRTVLRRSATPDGACLVGNPTFSPDGGSLALETCEGLATMRADGSGFRQLPRFSQPEQAGPFFYASDTEPAWSPEGRRLVFVSETGYDDGFVPQASGGLALMNADGSGASTLTAELVDRPDWSSRGLIAFSNRPRRGDPGIWVVRPDGSGLNRIVRRAQQPAWSPDGRRIAFACGRRGGAPFQTVDARICTVRVDGRGLRTVARGFFPAWSPNGKRLAFVQGTYVPGRPGRRGRSSWAVYTVRLDGSDLRLVTRSRRQLGALDWQPVSTGAQATAAPRRREVQAARS